jgi:hypothetical protein
MNECCLIQFCLQGIEENFRLAEEGEKQTCTTCNRTYQIVKGKWKEVTVAKKPLTQLELFHGGCSTPDCGHDHSTLYINQHCHEHAGLDVCYIKAEGILRMECHVCEKLVVDVKVHP